MRFSRFGLQEARATLTPTLTGELVFDSTYSADLVNELKTRIPFTARRWDSSGKHWLIDPKYADVAIRLAESYLGVTIPTIKATSTPAVETRVVKLDYLGRCKERGKNDSSALGWSEGGWNLVIPEAVLRAYFKADTAVTPDEPIRATTLYAVLGVDNKATADDLRTAYRRMAKVWHPDVSKDVDAAEQFKRIKGAWDVLGEPIKRKKYDFGLKLEGGVKKDRSFFRDMDIVQRVNTTTPGYRAPLCCGWLMVAGIASLGRFTVSNIAGWEDVTDDKGRVMVTSWARDDKQFTVDWV